MTYKWKDLVLLFFQGVLIGTGAILPGISGGVLCVAFGIYEPMMAFLSHPISSFKKNYKFLITIILGGGVGFILLAKIVESFLAFSAVAAMFLFCGLICGTVPELMRKSAQAGSEKGWAFFIIALIGSYIFFNVLDDGVTGNIQPGFWWYVFCGAIWGLCMVVPGLSSSSILLFMGLYQPMAKGIGDLDPYVLVPLLLGFFVTIAITARIMNMLIEKYYGIVSKVILGFVISSVLMIAPTMFEGPMQVVTGLVCFTAGFVIAMWMDSRNRDMQR